jgi:DNA polymerase-3 subunit gamma/tau
VRLFNQAAAEAKGGWQPQLPLEMAFIEAAQPAEAGNPTSGKQSPPSRPNPSSSARHSPASHTPSNPTAVRSASPATSQSVAAVREPEPTYGDLKPGDGALTPETLRGQWPDFLNALRPRNLPLEALMRSCEPLAVEGDIVVLGFTHDFHRSRVEEDQNRQDIEDVLAGLIGQRYRVRCVLLQQRATEPSPTPAKAAATPSTDLPKIDESAKQAAPPPVDSTMIDDPVVRAAIDDLGAVVRQ